MPLGGTAYSRLYNHLHKQIINKEFSPGDRLPSERELCETFGVSRITCRRALSMLQDHGLIERFPGSGTFVREIQSHKVPILDSDYSGSMKEQAPGTKRVLLAFEPVDPPENYRQIFGMLKTERCLLLERLDDMEGEALSFDRGFIPLQIATTIDREMAVQIDFLELWMEKQGLTYSYIRSSVEAIEADEAAVARLKCQPRAPALLTVDLVHSKDGRVLAIFESTYRGDRFKFVSTKSRRQASGPSP
ncbi:MAG: GntR family transcriptional regulator [Spirochaetota bacterium]